MTLLARRPTVTPEQRANDLDRRVCDILASIRQQATVEEVFVAMHILLEERITGPERLPSAIGQVVREQRRRR